MNNTPLQITQAWANTANNGLLNGVALQQLAHTQTIILPSQQQAFSTGYTMTGYDVTNNKNKLAKIIHLLPTSIIKWTLENMTDNYNYFLYMSKRQQEIDEMLNKVYNITEDTKKNLIKEFIARGLI